MQRVGMSKQMLLLGRMVRLLSVIMSVDDICEMNQGNAVFLYNEQGYVSFLQGKFFEEKVTDAEKGVESLMGIADLLGLSKGAEFFAVYGEQDAYGYRYFTYKQRYGDLTLENASLKIVLDPEGYTAGLVSSFTSNVGIAREEESAVTAREAEEIVREHNKGNYIKIYKTDFRDDSGSCLSCMGSFYESSGWRNREWRKGLPGASDWL